MARLSIPAKMRFEVFKRDDFTCQYCGRKPPEVELHCDHLVSVKNGGPTTILNLITSCSDCNFGKGSTSLDRKAVPILVNASEQQEKVNRLREYSELIRQEGELMEDYRDDVISRWCVLDGQDPNADVWNYPAKLDQAILRFFGKLSSKDVCDAINIAFRNLDNASNASRFRYFCAICWKWIREGKQD